MNLDQFITKYVGRKTDYDGYYGAQCMDLYRYYVKDVLGFPQSPGVRSAFQVWDNISESYFEKIENSVFGKPQRGDIAIWSRNFGPDGHIGIVLDARLLSFKVFEQNNPIGSPSRIWDHSYRHVIGWLRPSRRIIKTIQVGNKFGLLIIDGEAIGGMFARSVEGYRKMGESRGIKTVKEDNSFHKADIIIK